VFGPNVYSSLHGITHLNAVFLAAEILCQENPEVDAHIVIKPTHWKLAVFLRVAASILIAFLIRIPLVGVVWIKRRTVTLLEWVVFY